MPRYIDADENQYTILNKTGVEKQGVWEDVLNKMPTADVVEVVNCEYSIYDLLNDPIISEAASEK